MAVYEESRFKGNYIYRDSNNEEVLYLTPFRNNVITPRIDDFQITFTKGMRVDLIAKEYYGSELFEWIIMDANPKYLTPFEIKEGDVLVIPNPERVRQIE